MTPHPTPWTAETVTAGLCGFYHGIAGVGLVHSGMSWGTLVAGAFEG
jgi:hypothetical protein